MLSISQAAARKACAEMTAKLCHSRFDISQPIGSEWSDDLYNEKGTVARRQAALKRALMMSPK
jgi:hypothetical protein